MNERMIKYFALAMAFASLATRVFQWLTFAQAPSGEGGEKITPSEITQLQPVIQDTLNQSLMSAKVPILVEVKMTYIG